MLNKALFAVAFFVTLASASRGQPIEAPAPGKIGLTLSSTTTGSGRGKLNDGSTTFEDISIRNYAWSLSQHISLGGQRRLGLVADYELNDVDKGKSNLVPLPDQLQALGVSLRYFQPFDRQWMFSASVGAASQVTDTQLLSDGWNVRASAIGIYNKSRQITFMFGTAFNSAAQDLRIIPIFGFDWRSTEKWSVSLGFPRTGVTYKVNPKVALHLAVSGNGGVFYVKNDPSPGFAPRSLDDSRLQYIDARIGFGCNWKINETFRISGTIGQVLLRQIKYIDHDYKLRSRGTTPFLSLSGTISL